MSNSTILVATDLSERSAIAIERAARITAGTGAALHVLHVVDDALPAAVTREICANIKSLLENLAAGLEREKLRNAQVDIRCGTVWKTILAVAEETNAGLIVLGSHRSRGIVELFLGTTLERIARSASIPILMVATEPQADYRHVAVGIDFSPAARNAIVQAATLAPEARFSLVSTYHVIFRAFIDRSEPGDSDIKAETRRIERELKERMSEFVKTGPDFPNVYGSVFLEDGPLNGLCRFATKEDVDLISVGSHGRSWIVRAFLGSTAAELLHSAPCDVLVARP